MSKKKNKKYIITSEQMFDFQKPKYNGFICRGGAHGDKKYNRRKEKDRWKKDLLDE